VLRVMGKPEAVVPAQGSEILNYQLTKITGDEPEDTGWLGREGGLSPGSSSRVRSPRPYRLQLSENRLVAFGIISELESGKPILAEAIELGVYGEKHWKAYEIKTKELRLGMSKDDVIKVLGQPNSVGANRQYEYLNYLRHSNGESGERRYKLRAYIARFVNGRLERFWCEPF